MLLNKKGQSTAEYAIVIGLVVAVAAGILSTAVRGGMRQQNDKAVNYMLNAGSDTPDFYNQQVNAEENLFTSDWRATTVKQEGYIDKTVRDKGGVEKKEQKQTTANESVTVETIDAIPTQ